MFSVQFWEKAAHINIQLAQDHWNTELSVKECFCFVFLKYGSSIVGHVLKFYLFQLHVANLFNPSEAFQSWAS